MDIDFFSNSCFKKLVKSNFYNLASNANIYMFAI